MPKNIVKMNRKCNGVTERKCARENRKINYLTNDVKKIGKQGEKIKRLKVKGKIHE